MGRVIPADANATWDDARKVFDSLPYEDQQFYMDIGGEKRDGRPASPAQCEDDAVYLVLMDMRRKAEVKS